MDDSLTSTLRTEYQQLAMAEQDVWSADIEMTHNPMKKGRPALNKSAVAAERSDSDSDRGNEDEEVRLRRLSSAAPEIHRRESGGVITIAGMD